MKNVVNLLQQLVEIPSAYPNEQAIGTFLYDLLCTNGFEVEKHYIRENRFNILATKGRSNQQSICFYGHMDTVAVNETEWKTNPYELEVKNKKAFGCGAFDMKAGIAAFIEATKNSTQYIKLFLAVDEEYISEGAWNAFDDRKDFFSDVKLFISAEPNFEGNLNNITTGRTGRCVVNVEFTGKEAHIAKFQDGQDAAEMMGEFLSIFYKNRFKLFNSPETVALVRKVSGESNGMSVCAQTQLEIEIFLAHPDTSESTISAIESISSSAKVFLKPRKTPYLSAYQFDKFPLQQEIAEIIKAETGSPMILSRRSSVGDDNVLAQLGIPVITWGPDGGNAHSANEYVDLSSLEILYKMYVKILQ